MKNLLIHINPEKKFDSESSKLVKVQIDNSLELGWKKKDILLVTNFDYKYKDVKAVVVSDKCYCEAWPRATKITTTLHLIKKGIITNDLYWFHDFDAFQLVKFKPPNLAKYDLGIIDYGQVNKWNSGSFFFKKEAKDILELIVKNVNKYKVSEEDAFMKVIDKYTERYRKLNKTYNFGVTGADKNYQIAKKPLKVVHFHPLKSRHLAKFIYGKNANKVPFATQRLASLFKRHGIMPYYTVKKEDEHYGFKLRTRKNVFDGKIITSVLGGKNQYRIPANPKVILDIGANIGTFALLAAKAGATVYAYEPEKTNYETLLYNVELNGYKDCIRCINRGVGIPGKTKLYIHNKNSGASSAYVNIDASLSADNYQVCDFISIMDVFEINDIEHCNLLKMDCEGSEKDIIKDLTPDLIEKIGQISVEIHDNAEREPIFEKLGKFYKKIKRTDNRVWIFKHG